MNIFYEVAFCAVTYITYFLALLGFTRLFKPVNHVNTSIVIKSLDFANYFVIFSYAYVSYKYDVPIKDIPVIQFVVGYMVYRLVLLLLKFETLKQRHGSGLNFSELRLWRCLITLAECCTYYYAESRLLAMKIILGILIGIPTPGLVFYSNKNVSLFLFFIKFSTWLYLLVSSLGSISMTVIYGMKIFIESLYFCMKYDRKVGNIKIQESC